MQIDWKVSIHSEYFLFSNVLLKNISYKKTEQWPTLPRLSPQRFRHLSPCVISECMTSVQNSRLCEWNHCRQLLALLQHLESVNGKMLFQRTENVKVIWCQVRAMKWMFETLPSTLLQQGCHLSGCVRYWPQVTVMFFDL